VVTSPPTDLSRIFFGAWVTLLDDAGEEHRHRIVGPDEFDLAPGYISMDSPLARALQRHRVDDEIVVELPDGRRTFVVAAIQYPLAESPTLEPSPVVPTLDELPDDADTADGTDDED
jgi:transcription elongation factor GreB